LGYALREADVACINATHHYRGDTVTLNSKKDTEVLENSNLEPDAKWLRKTEVAVAQVSNLGERIGVSPLRLRQVRDYVAHHTTDHALFSIAELDENDDMETKHTVKRQLKRKSQLKWRREWSAKAAALILLWTKFKRTSAACNSMLQQRIWHVRGVRKICERARLHCWYNKPWDFGEKVDVRYDKPEMTKVSEVWADFESKTTVPDQWAKVKDCDDDEAEGIQKTKVAIASASNPGAHDNAAPLKPRYVSDLLSPDLSDGLSAQESNVLSVDDVHQVLEDLAPRTEQPEILISADNSIFTRMTAPFKSECVAEILRLVEIEEDLSPEERHEVKQVIRDFADVFALLVKEVKHIPGATHHFQILENAKFNTKICQWPMSPPQTEYFSKALDIMLDAGICAPIAMKDVKCVSPITLATKAHTSAGMMIDELRQWLNQECENIGVSPPFVGPSNIGQIPDKPATPDLPAKWCVCTNYMKLNEVTQVLQMLQGDIRTKQQALSGHRWISMFDFAAGFYAVEIAKESHPYTAFYVEGRGYFVYCCMPFRLTGAPSCFNEVMAQALHGLVRTMIQLFVDDGAMAGDIFTDKLANLRTFFTRCKEENLSILPQKTKLFMSKVVFAGERVGTDGIQADLSKLTAVVNWETPTTIQNLKAFLGLTGYFRPLIKNYSLLEKPLKDLANLLDVLEEGGKQSYQNAAWVHQLESHWTSVHD
jgi:hypothetical protein